MTPLPIHADAVRPIELLLLDVDGVLTDGRLYVGPDGMTSKAFHVRDGLGITQLLRAGVEVGLISGRDDRAVRARAKELGLRSVLLGESNKGEAVVRLLAERNLAATQAAFVADDVNDLPALEQVGVSIAVADAHPDVLAAVKFVTRASGGEGAVREVADAILSARGRGPSSRRLGRAEEEVTQ